MRRRRITAAATLTLLALTIAAPAWSGPSIPPQAAVTPVTLVDGLAGADPDVPFDLSGGGHGGTVIYAEQYPGPQFTLTRQTLITEIGAFLVLLEGSSNRPFEVQIRASVDGAPHPTTVLATLPMTWDGDPTLASYETTQGRTLLPPGTYYAVFAPRDDSVVGSLLGSVPGYLAGLVTEGAVHPGGPSAAGTQQFEAVRIIGLELPR